MAIETAADCAKRLMDEIGEAAQGSYSKGEVRTILNVIAQKKLQSGEDMATVDKIRRGDVFIAKHTGGKIRPWVVLSARDGIVCAVSLSSGDSAPAMEPAQCRLWKGVWIGTTVSLFKEDQVNTAISRPYTNLTHLKQVEDKLTRLFGFAKPVKKAAKKPGLRAVS